MAVLLGRADRDQDGVDAAFASGLDLGPGEALEKALLGQLPLACP
ncbi:MAG: hypothetical protein ACRDMY_06805 [Gaiellaceae bacterium]